MELTVIKKDGNQYPFDMQCIHVAVEHSAECIRGLRFENGRQVENAYSNGTHLSDEEWNELDRLIYKQLSCRSSETIRTSALHQLVIKSLAEVAFDVAEAYREFHYEKKQWKKQLEEAMDARENMSTNTSNANADARLASTIKVLVADGYEKGTNMSQLMTAQDQEAHHKGNVYWHDLSALQTYPYNCCVFDGQAIINHPFSINGVTYPVPSSLRQAFSTIEDVIFCIASNQYGGCTCPRIDTLLAPFAEKEYQKSFSYFCGLGVDVSRAAQAAYEHTLHEMYNGFKCMEIRFNTVGSSRGDYPFITLTGGADADETFYSNPWAALLWDTALKVRMEGQGEEGKRRPVLFPKLVFLYDETLHGTGKTLEWLFEDAIKCSAVTMYPDYLSLTGNGYVPEIYKKYGRIVSPMGCRAFLSPWYERGGLHPADKSDIPVFEGRFNIGVISLNLPMIYGEAKEQGVDFYILLDYHLELIRRAFKRRYRMLAQLPASRNPLMFMEGGAYNPLTNGPAYLSANERIAPLLKCATASFGITALQELQEFHNGKSLVEDGQFALEVLTHINKRIEAFKEEDGYLYAIYGTPAESLCGVQARQLKKRFGILKGVSDREYVSNSFHCHVTEDITPIQKQDLENRFWNLCNGGKIQYVKYPLQYNIEAIRSLVRRAMEMGFYEGVNLDLNFCSDCGKSFDGIDGDCPCCGSPNIFSISRMNGYLGYSRQGSTTQKGYNSKMHSRFNPAKRTEIRERVSM